MASSHSTDPKTLARETLPLSAGASGAREGIGSSHEVIAPGNALQGSAADPLDCAQEKASQLAREIDAVLRSPRASANPASTADRTENRPAGDDLVSGTVQQYAASLTELQQRFDALVFEHSETRNERDELARQLASATSGSPEAEPRNAEKSLNSVRQARDTALARNVVLSEKLTASEERIAELEDELERAERARDAALALSRDLSETCDELREQALKLTRERDLLHDQVTGVSNGSGGCAHNISATADDADCAAAQGSTTESLNPSEASVALAAMQACLESLAADTGNRGILDELESHFHSFGERAGAEGCVALGRLSAACEQLTSWLRKAPGKISENIEPLAKAVELLVNIAATGEPERITDPTDALVYSLDDDVDNCECITMAMEKIALKARYATKAEIALKDLTAGPCDLIIFDLDLRDTNGFDLFIRVRALGHHEKTPVIFLSGASKSTARTAEFRDNAHVFVRKPYNLNTLGLIALCMILKARLAALEEELPQGRNAKRRPRIKAQGV